jgi:hypothetical protein
MSVSRRRVLLRLAAALLAWPLAAGAALSDARVLLENGLVSIHSQSAPLAEVLTRFAQATGAEVVYEASRPRQPVTVAIEGASPAEAIARLLEGQGLDYVLRLDRTGTKVELLVVSGTGSPAAASGPAAARTSAPARVEESPEDAGEPAEEPFVPEAVDEHEAQTQAPASTDDTARAPHYVPFAGSAPGPTSPPEAQVPSSGTMPFGPSVTEPAPPQPPAPASYPGSPSAPPPPVPPRPVSYPPGS